MSIVHSSRIPGASGDESGPFAFAGGRGHSVERNIPIQRVFRHEEPYHQLSELKEENSRLLNQLQSMQQNYQELLKTNLAEKQVQMQVVLAAKSTGGYRQIVRFEIRGS